MKRLLVVDDSPAVRNSIIRNLKDDFEIDIATTLEEALIRLNDDARRYDIVSTDGRIPRRSGGVAEFLGPEVVAAAKGKKIYVVGFSATDNIPGCNKYYNKAFAEEYLDEMHELSRE